jgi:tape measure domain-containing protein
VIGAGGNVDAAKLAFEGIAAGIRGTGGNLSDMQSALLATSQVFSKGKVSAEELRQQIGERLPGAFTIFAQSIGKTPQELDKMLEKGEVGLNDFMKFVQELQNALWQPLQMRSPPAAKLQATGWQPRLHAFVKQWVVSCSRWVRSSKKRLQRRLLKTSRRLLTLQKALQQPQKLLPTTLA